MTLAAFEEKKKPNKQYIRKHEENCHNFSQWKAIPPLYKLDDFMLASGFKSQTAMLYERIKSPDSLPYI